MEMKVKKQPSKLIKPLVPTPSTLSQYNIGFIDGIVPESDVPIILFYPPKRNHNQNFVVQLEKSLEKLLTRLYPLAGRYVDETKIFDCNDEGVEFIQAKVNITLEDFLGFEMSVNLVDEFIPFKFRVAINFTDPLLAIQVTLFKCGGVAIGVSATHKIADAGTLSIFLKEWADMNRKDNDIDLGPRFVSSSMFPARGVHPDPFQCMTVDDMVNKFIIRKKYSFSGSEILNMKAKASRKDSTHYWSKVQLVSAIIWKAFIDVDLAIHNNPRESILFTPMSIRGRMASLIPKHACGNLIGSIETKSRMLETTEELVDLINDSIKKTISNYSKVYHDREEGQKIVYDSWLKTKNIPESAHVITISSWCRQSFYDADFGLGEPIWVTPATIPGKNFALLMDDVGGNGVEAYVCLEVKDVPYFEKSLDDQRF